MSRPPRTSVVDSGSKPCRSSSLQLVKDRKARLPQSLELDTDVEDILCSFSQQTADHIKTQLLRWYDTHKRQLPWRSTSPVNSTRELEHVLPRGCEGTACEEELKLRQQRAYGTWVSEVMLQQTRVATVVEYFNRWMEKWPTVHHLAEATQEEVNTLWAGLGYYRRARFLLEGARQIVELRGGLLPSTAEELQKIRGIGKYTAGAIASIAFNQPVPVVDGNVIRVLCRLKAISDNPKASSTLKSLWSLAEQLVDEKRPGDLNQALMELGATQCSLHAPVCSSCPLGGNCEAFSLSQASNGSQNPVQVTNFPTKVAKSSPRQDYVAVCVLEEIRNSAADGWFLLVKRPQKGLLAGLWEFPSVYLDGPKTSVEAQKAAMDKYLRGLLGFQIGKGCNALKARESVGTYKHTFSHIRMHMSIEWVQLYSNGHGKMSQTSKQEGTVIKWVHATEMQDVGLTSGVRKAYEMVLDYHHGDSSEVRSKLKVANTKRKR